MAGDNKTIGRFHLTDIPPAQRGMPKIEVTFDIDANGILSVSAKDQGTGKEQQIRIEASSGLTDEEIEHMKKEAEANADSDKAAKETAEKVNAADGLIFQTESQLKEYGEKLSEGNKTAIEAALVELKEAHTAKDLAKIDSSMETLNAAWQNASQEIYQAQQADGGAQPGPDAAAGEQNADSAEDVDFEEVEEVSDKK